jgi:hypothetical protein
VTGLDAAAAAGLVLVGVATVLHVRLAARASGLGRLHPTPQRPALEAFLFGVGSAALAFANGRPGPAVYFAGCCFATADLSPNPAIGVIA